MPTLVAQPIGGRRNNRNTHAFTFTHVRLQEVPVTTVQRHAEAGVLDGIYGVPLHRLSAIGSHGQHPANLERDLHRCPWMDNILLTVLGLRDCILKPCKACPAKHRTQVHPAGLWGHQAQALQSPCPLQKERPGG
eukprot:11915508-Alexandrium_andersonii.AAC.1